MNHPLFTGACTALVTPFLGNQINFPMLQQLICRQIEAGVRAIVLTGTTGEASTLSDSEKIEIYERGKEYAQGQCLMIAGTGSNCTEHAVDLSVAAEDAGIDALLVVSPYYNKANAEGLLAHYLAIAHAVSIPLILYNVPSRTGVDIPVSVYQRLSSVPNIAGVKEATGDIRKITHIINECNDSFQVWSGNDDMTVPMISIGAKGVISVTSNVYPAEISTMCHAALSGDYITASRIQKALQPVNDLMFTDINPIPVKAAMKHIGFDCGNCRMPLSKPSHALNQRIAEIIS